MQMRLQYGRFQGEYQFFVSSYTLAEDVEDDDVETEPSPLGWAWVGPDDDHQRRIVDRSDMAWPNCPRAVKLAAYSTLPGLLDMMMQAASQHASWALDTVQAVIGSQAAIQAEALTGSKPDSVRSRRRRQVASD